MAQIVTKLLQPFLEDVTTALLSHANNPPTDNRAVLKQVLLKGK